MKKIGLCAFLLVSIACPARAAEHYVEHSSPVLAQVQPDRALVYFAHGIRLIGKLRKKDSAQIEVFVDAEPIGFLPHNSYTVALVEPGFRQIYPNQWIDFKPGKTYLLRTEHPLWEWFLDDPTKIGDLKFTYVSATEAGLGKLRQQKWRQKYDKRRAKSWQKYNKKFKKAGQSIAMSLPITFKMSVYKKKLGKLKFPGFTRGKLIVDKNKILWASKKKKLEIAIQDIQQASFDGLAMGAAFGWIRIRYGGADGPQDVFLGSPTTERSLIENYNRLFAAIMDAMEHNKPPQQAPISGYN